MHMYPHECVCVFHKFGQIVWCIKKHKRLETNIVLNLTKHNGHFLLLFFLIKKEGVHFQPFVCFDPFSERCQSILFQILCVWGVHVIRLLCTADAMLVTQSSCKCDIEQINQL